MPKKDKFADLDQEIKTAICSMNEAEIRSKLSEVSLNQAALMAAKEEDQDLKEKKEAASDAGTIYRDGTKQNRLTVEYARQVLGDRAKDNGSFEQP